MRNAKLRTLCTRDVSGATVYIGACLTAALWFSATLLAQTAAITPVMLQHNGYQLLLLMSVPCGVVIGAVTGGAIQAQRVGESAIAWGAWGVTSFPVLALLLDGVFRHHLGEALVTSSPFVLWDTVVAILLLRLQRTA